VQANNWIYQGFTTAGTSITGGYVDLSAPLGSFADQATFGIYRTADAATNTLSGMVGSSVTVAVGTFGGVHFTFSPPIAVTPGEVLSLGATAQSPMTAYQQFGGCYISNVYGAT
jgi:hypothetical protein